MIQPARHQQLAMISVPWQEYVTPMAPAEALMSGTVFSNLAQTYTPSTLSPACMQAASAQNMQTMQNMQMTQNMTHTNTMSNPMQMQNMGMQKKR